MVGARFAGASVSRGTAINSLIALPYRLGFLAKSSLPSSLDARPFRARIVRLQIVRPALCPLTVVDPLRYGPRGFRPTILHVPNFRLPDSQPLRFLPSPCSPSR